LENIEIKARVADFMQLRKRVLAESESYVGLDNQVDTYFKTRKGRLKLRESTLSGAYLIPYRRKDEHGPKRSSYQKLVVDDVVGVKDLLSELLGVHKVIRKKREIFLYKNVRIHLDQVEHLGDFLELEGVLDNATNDVSQEKEKIFHLMHELGIEIDDLVADSYENLIR
jgi:predicted adenylyl cyclase CyaB